MAGSPTPPGNDESEDQPKRRSKGGLRRFVRTDFRTHFWNLLDYFEEHRRLRLGLMIGLPLVIALGVGAYWAYDRWEHVNSLKIARQWLDAGRFDRAPAAVQEAISFAPDQPEPWRLASELAWRRGNKAASTEYAKKAATLSGYNADYTLSWAEAGILAGKPAEAAKALTFLDQASVHSSARALRVSGELYRLAGNFPEAKQRFNEAREVDVAAGVDALAKDEVPLGIVSLRTGIADDRTRGLALLEKWSTEPDWGAEALRSLLADATDHDDHPAMVKWAEALRANPKVTVGDLPHCLLAVSRADEGRFQAMLIALESICSTDSARAAELIGWMNQINRSKEAVAWSHTLTKLPVHQPPLCVAIAEALRSDGKWGELQAWTESGDWGESVDFIRLAYGMEANRNLGNNPMADQLWATLQSRVQASGVHALFAADTIYSWGRHDEALSLLWVASESPGIKIDALGTLVRHYQVQKDAVGEYRVFAKLYSVQPHDPNIANNFAFFATLTGQGNTTEALRIARDNLAHAPNNRSFRATEAYILAMTGHAAEALELLKPVADQWQSDQAVAFAYTITLGALGRKMDAKPVYDVIDKTQLTAPELDQLSGSIN